LIVESLLGLTRHASTLHFAPCLPADWPRVEVNYCYGETVYRIALVQTPGAVTGTVVTVDGAGQPDRTVPLVDDREEHIIEVSVSGGQGSDRAE
jgi:cellobiose phosphorylase